MLKILYEDPHLIVAEKPSGVESQSSGGFQPDMVSMIQNHIAAQANQTSGKICTDLSTNWGKLSTKQVEKKGKTGAPYVGVIHRLDKPVQGILVYAKTKETAKALSRLISEGKTEKYYFAVVCGKPVEKEGTFVDYLRKDPKKNESAVVDKAAPGAREARLSYQVLESRRIDGEDLSLVGIRLETGRHHQIRVQFSSHSLPLWGDNRYHPDFQNGKRRGSIALCAAGLAFVHPITGKRMEFSINPRGAAFSWFEKPQVYFAGGDAY